MSSPVRRELEEYLAGRASPERVVIAAAVAYYRDTRGGMREALRPVIDVIDRASPGIVELGGVQGGLGFEVRLAERRFPERFDSELRRAVEAALAVGAPPAPPAPLASPAPGVVQRVLGAIRRLFTA